MCGIVGIPVDAINDALKVLGFNIGYADPGAPHRRRTCTRFVFLLAFVARVADIWNLVLDAIFIEKLFSEPEDKRWARLMTSAAVASFLGTMVVTNVLMDHIKRFDARGRDIGKKRAYFGFWSVSELSAFLVEDATTIFLYSHVEGAFDASGVAGRMNVCTSIASGVLSCVALTVLSTFVYETWKEKKDAVVLLGLGWLFVGYFLFVSIHSLFLGNQLRGVASDFLFFIMILSSCFGYCLLIHNVRALLAYKFYPFSCAGKDWWPSFDDKDSTINDEV